MTQCEFRLVNGLWTFQQPDGGRLVVGEVGDDPKALKAMLTELLSRIHCIPAADVEIVFCIEAD